MFPEESDCSSLTDRMLPPMAISTVSLMLLSCLMLQFGVQVKDSKNENLFPFIQCPKVSFGWPSQCYALNVTPKSWYDAEEACKMWPNGHLASVLSTLESSYLSSLLTGHVDSYQRVWIGLHDPTGGLSPNGHGWKWVDGQNMYYINWERNPSTAPDRDFCGCLTANSGYLMWRDYHCEIPLPFVCKMKHIKEEKLQLEFTI